MHNYCISKQRRACYLFLGNLTGFKKLEDTTAEWLIENMPDKATQEMAYIVGGVFYNLANEMMGLSEPDRQPMNLAKLEQIVKNLERLDQTE